MAWGNSTSRTTSCSGRPKSKESEPLPWVLAPSPMPSLQPFCTCNLPCCTALLRLPLNVVLTSPISWMPSEKTYLKYYPTEIKSPCCPTCTHASSPKPCPRHAWKWILGVCMPFFLMCLYSSSHVGAIHHCHRYINKIKLKIILDPCRDHAPGWVNPMWVNLVSHLPNNRKVVTVTRNSVLALGRSPAPHSLLWTG